MVYRQTITMDDQLYGESTRLQSRDLKQSWMAWTVELYCPKSDWDNEYTDGQICTAIAMWTTAVTVVVPLALFLFAAIADSCCCCCNAEEEDDSLRLNSITSSNTEHTLSISAIEGHLLNGLRALYLSQRRYPSQKGENPICSLLYLTEISDQPLLAEVQKLYTQFSRELGPDGDVRAKGLYDDFRLNSWLKQQADLTVTATNSALFVRLLDIVRYVVTATKES